MSNSTAINGEYIFEQFLVIFVDKKIFISPMAKVEYMAPVEAIHGKLSKSDRYVFAKRKKQNSAGERVAYTFRHTRSETAPSQEVLVRRSKFATAVKATRERLNDPDRSLADMIAYAQQTKYKTIYSYVFNQEYNKD